MIVLSPCVPLDDGNDDECNAITELLRGGQMWPVIDAVYPLTASREALGRLQEASQFGKIRHSRTPQVQWCITRARLHDLGHDRAS
jgi:hypothetical protein